ncbi:hypothetical protein [Synechocystis sp. LKSZ1]|uniref:hypothetical protein n=1 Tax=Synechocystis sp. LKSZ1 TaxID=3144951 RepID=UPI00336BDFD6
MPSSSLVSLLDRLGDWNPQLYRELKSRYSLRTGQMVVVASAIAQGLLFFILQAGLPDKLSRFNRYCLGSPPPEYENSYYNGLFCTKDFLGNLIINWPLWWLDVFVTLSTVSILLLWVGGVYLLITDLAQENGRGTLNFLRLSPRSVLTLLWGKLLGVPSLVYGFLALAIPLHLVAALAANIPLPLLLSFYAVLGAGSVFCFALAILIGLAMGKDNLGQAFAISGLLAIVLTAMTLTTLQGGYQERHYLWEWLQLFYPGQALYYLADATFLSEQSLDYLRSDQLLGLRWYGLPVFQQDWSGLAFIILNYSLWSYWLFQGLQRCFRSPQRSTWSKAQSYGMTLTLIVTVAGFFFQDMGIKGVMDNPQQVAVYLRGNFVILQLILWAFFLVLTNALSLSRDTLRTWARYRHQAPQHQRSLWTDLLWGEQSPAPLALLANWGIVVLYLIPIMVFLPLGNYRLSLGFGLILGASFSLILALAFQYGLLRLAVNRLFLGVGLLLLSGLIPLGVALLFKSFGAHVLWFSVLPMAASTAGAGAAFWLSLIAQLSTLALLSAFLRRHLQHLGRSETYWLSASPQARPSLPKP